MVKTRVELRTDAQRHVYSMFPHVDVLFLLGPAGVGKSFLATALAIRQIEREQAERIIITRPIVESEESLGYLPGDLREKTDPYMAPLYDQIERLKHDEAREFTRKYVTVSPLAYMRGRTFNDAVCIFDEAQNANIKQLKLHLTRLGEGGKIIITGDTTQSDIRDSGLAEVVDRLNNVPGVGIVRFEGADIVRHPVVERILERLP